MENDDSTLLTTSSGSQLADRRMVVDITYSLPDGERRALRFSKGFRIGRSQGCEVRINDYRVSREHLQVYWEGERWWLRDLGSSNGTYLHGKLIHQLPLSGKTTLELGSGGPLVQLEVVSSAQSTSEAEHPTKGLEHS
ncbi:MAG: FHA domain-containing protein, partial [Acidobacteria bacterium]|nr:FHA domain-containing protein [Acidobacteriota bacterium]